MVTCYRPHPSTGLKLGESRTWKNVSWVNHAGGTSFDHRGALSFRATVLKGWEDYECGWRYWARLDEDIRATDDLLGPITLKAGACVFLGEFDLKTS